jgi:hypothetical protein
MERTAGVPRAVVEERVERGFEAARLALVERESVEGRIDRPVEDRGAQPIRE